jgi:hypothetical protein
MLGLAAVDADSVWHALQAATTRESHPPFHYFEPTEEEWLQGPDFLCERHIAAAEAMTPALDAFVLNRVLDRRLQMLQRQGRLGFYMTSRGEEATILGVAMTLNADDPIFLSYRELGCLLWRRVPLALIFNQLIGNSQDLCRGRQMPVHYCYREWGIPSVSSPVGTQLPHAPIGPTRTYVSAWRVRFTTAGRLKRQEARARAAH